MTGWLAAACAAVLMLCSDTAMDSALRAAQVFVSGVMPALLPMMVLGRITPADAGGRVQMTVMGWLSGSPAAAQRACALWQAGRVRRLEKLLCLTGVMSPTFFTGTLPAWGVPVHAAWRMLACHWLGAALCALCWRDRSPAPKGGAAVQPALSLPAAIEQSARAMLAVCGAMMLFSIAAGLARRALGGGPGMDVLWALLEAGGGAHAVLQGFAQPPYALLCGLCSFGGLSIWLQNLLFTRQSVRPVRLLGMRALHGAMSFGLYFFSLKIQNLLTT